MQSARYSAPLYTGVMTLTRGESGSGAGTGDQSPVTRCSPLKQQAKGGVPSSGNSAVSRRRAARISGSDMVDGLICSTPPEALALVTRGNAPNGCIERLRSRLRDRSELDESLQVGMLERGACCGSAPARTFSTNLVNSSRSPRKSWG